MTAKNTARNIPRPPYFILWRINAKVWNAISIGHGENPETEVDWPRAETAKVIGLQTSS